MNIELHAVGVDDLRVQRLLQFYLHEWSARVPISIGPDALFSYPNLNRFTATLFVIEGRPAGVALTLDEPGATHLEEFYLAAGERRRGVGRAAAELLFKEAPGSWTATVRPENPESSAFLKKLKPGALLETVTVDGEQKTRLRFSA